MEKENLVELVRRAQSGDAKALQELYIDSSKNVYFLALRMLKNPDDAEDVTQDVFMTVFEKISDLQQPVTYYKWLQQIASNRCLNFLRRKKAVSFDDQELLLALEQEDTTDPTTPENLYDDEETRRLIMEIIDALPDEQRICVIYRYFNQLSIEEISVITEANENTVKNRLAVARKKIRAAILDKEDKEGIRLHVLIPIMPVLMKALDEFQMPEGLTEKMWTRIAEGAGIAAASNTPGADGTSGQNVQKSHGSETEPPGRNAGTDAPTHNEPTEQKQPNQAKGEIDNMGNNGSYGPPQPRQAPQGNNPYQQGQPVRSQQGYSPQGQSVQTMPPSTTPAPPTVMSAAQTGAGMTAKAGLSIAAKIGIAAASVAVVAGLVLGGIFILPQLLDKEGEPNTPPAQSVTDGGGASDTQSPGDDSVASTPGQSETMEEQEVTITVDGEEYTGIYEGGYANGLFSGYGVWVYENWRYEGGWENGMPNGEGKVTVLSTINYVDYGVTLPYTITYETAWENGFASGTLTETWAIDGTDPHGGENTHQWIFENVENGVLPTGMFQCVLCSHESGRRSVTGEIIGVFPWSL